MKTKNIIIASAAGIVFLFLFALPSSAQGTEELFHIPGTTEGKGKHFEITDSEYLNISLDSSEKIEARIESMPEMIAIHIKASGESFSDMTISGLSDDTTYHKYEDDYHNYAPLVSNEDGKASFSQDIKKDHIIFIQPRKSTKFIRDDDTGGDCESIGDWDASEKICTLSEDVDETIQIDNDGITLDGAEHFLTGKGTGTGVYAYNKKDLVVRNLTISGFYNGISFSASSSNNKIMFNTLKHSCPKPLNFI